ncbi:recombinase family protein [Azonexus hydrophilus]|uniref:recombinase family protein n=1 Tax=Azonexus hydrophilus TaxID=418702 RepID=UPI00042684A9|nr:recombinase family protein [Azonexus hydrophilus]
MQAKVISYTRFSTLAQAKGQSLRRQEEKAETWAVARGLKLDESLRLRDLGVSAWSGANVETGALAVLLKMAKEREIEPGTILVIEAMDRLTRQCLEDSIPLFIDLLKSGIELVTLQDNQHYTKESLKDLAKFITAIILLSGGNRESEIKSERVRDAYESHRKRGSAQIFGSAPGWLIRDDKFSPWRLHPEKSKVVRKAFELMAEGWGSVEIAKKANAEGWIVPTRLGEKRAKGWTASMASKIVRSRSAIGEHEHRNRTREANKKNWHGESRGVVVKNYYPAVVDEELFYKVQAAIDRRHKPEGRDQWYFNIWSGLICCGKCGGGVWRKTDFATKTLGQLRCRNSAASLCDEPSISIKQVDAPLLFHIAQFASAQLSDMDTNLAKLDADSSRLAEVDAAAANLAEVIAKGVNLPALVEKASALSIQRAKITSEIERLRKLIAEHSGSMFDSSFAETLLPVLYERSEIAKEQRAKANLVLRRLIDKVELVASEESVFVTFKDSRARLLVKVTKLSVDAPIRTSDDDDT